MKIAAVFAFGSLFSLAACAGGKKTPVKTDVAARPYITSMRMDRSACFGRCPVYSIELTRDGSARYLGKAFTSHQGIWEKNVGSEKVASIFSEYQKMRVDTCRDEYQMLVSDLPGLYYTFTFSDKSSKQINNANFGPVFLTNLAQQIDNSIVVDKTWKKVADTVEQR